MKLFTIAITAAACLLILQLPLMTNFATVRGADSHDSLEEIKSLLYDKLALKMKADKDWLHYDFNEMSEPLHLKLSIQCFPDLEALHKRVSEHRADLSQPGGGRVPYTLGDFTTPLGRHAVLIGVGTVLILVIDTADDGMAQLSEEPVKTTLEKMVKLIQQHQKEATP